ncbi:uncharacterized protein LOC111706140 isoform X2 [Eurytemora carolleeae]|uniref:uncharacterized protein LOC111706140 isoform X2 n=1 Tax=Eurytemora carolleeae TaxID=1294199 RepID=UPI000C75C1F9|nr:uncharacterized protein LOC111706140 isoform X2 [Eurytemora carolleeae]|eukprot:XP_023334693.1 uncharacterized protein LOC111706140 isoform X2 [Eurytemora affinis]
MNKINLSPAEIKFIPGLETEIDLHLIDDSNLLKLVQFVNKKKLVLQVTQICSQWFALNSLALCVYKHLQYTGCLSTISIQKVDPAFVPSSFIRCIEQGREQVNSISARLTRLDEDEDDWECGVCEEWFVSHQSLEDHRLYFQHWGRGQTTGPRTNLQMRTRMRTRMRIQRIPRMV